jgi:aryl carrier-like protein
LGVDRIGIGDDFFEMGGDSLLAIRLAARVGAALGTTVTIADVYAHPTAADMAMWLGRHEAANAAPRPELRPRTSGASR